MFQDRIRYELRIMGIWMILIPPLIILTFVLLGLMLTIMQVDHLRISQVLTASLEMVLPLSAGLLTTSIVSLAYTYCQVRWDCFVRKTGEKLFPVREHARLEG